MLTNWTSSAPVPPRPALKHPQVRLVVAHLVPSFLRAYDDCPARRWPASGPAAVQCVVSNVQLVQDSPASVRTMIVTPSGTSRYARLGERLGYNSVATVVNDIPDCMCDERQRGEHCAGRRAQREAATALPRTRPTPLIGQRDPCVTPPASGLGPRGRPMRHRAPTRDRFRSAHQQPPKRCRPEWLPRTQRAPSAAAAR